jgi:hypothetical protein
LKLSIAFGLVFRTSQTAVAVPFEATGISTIGVVPVLAVSVLGTDGKKPVVPALPSETVSLETNCTKLVWPTLLAAAPSEEPGVIGSAAFATLIVDTQRRTPVGTLLKEAFRRVP